MISFFNTPQRYLISTNQKVLFSLLSNQPTLKRLSPSFVYGYLHYQKWSPFWPVRHFLLVRNPYDRLESFFKDKFRQEPSSHSLDYENLQYCQKKFYPYFGIERDDSADMIREKLLTTSFRTFIDALSHVYGEDAHLYPQTQSIARLYDDVAKGLERFDRILKVDVSDDLAYLQDTLSINVSHRYNNTDGIHLTNPWTADSLTMVNRLYQLDFQALRYKMKT